MPAKRSYCKETELVPAAVKDIPRADVASRTINPPGAPAKKVGVASASTGPEVVPADTALFVQLLDPLDSQRNQPGERFAGELMPTSKWATPSWFFHPNGYASSPDNFAQISR